MGTKRRILWAILVVTVLGGLAWEVLPQREPIYRGKPLNYWLQGFELDGWRGKPTSDEAVDAVRQAGTNAFPILFHLLRTRDTDLKQRFTLLAQKQSVIRIHYVSADGKQWEARMAFVALLGPVARQAVPELIEINQEDIARNARYRYAAEILDLLNQEDERAGWGGAKPLKKDDAGAVSNTGAR